MRKMFQCEEDDQGQKESDLMEKILRLRERGPVEPQDGSAEEERESLKGIGIHEEET